MSKIGEFEQRIMKQGLTDEDFFEYEKLLKRVHDNFLKRQHCYTTAIKLSDKYPEQAIRLIKYGLESYEDNWFSTYTSYLYIGHIYEKMGRYQNAYDSYLLAKDALGTEHPDYIDELSKDIFWMKLHIDSFQYSTEMEDAYSHYTKSSEFSQSFVKSQFRLAVGSIVISLHYGKTDEAERSLAVAKEICKPNFNGKLHHILSKHNYHESLNETPESIAFIKNIRI